MSRLIPSNLSSVKRKLYKRHKIFSFGHSTAYGERRSKNTNVCDAGVQMLNQNGSSGTTEGETLLKRRPVPVVMVDQDPMQEMDPDEYGAELGKEARVWKVYVKETDQSDAELVDGWNRSLDVILVFAALFSAVSTTFLIESSSKLQQDPNDVSAAALLSISQVLRVIANSSTLDLPSSDPNAASEFVPSQHAVIVNTLWYLSLSLSIATSLLAMLAKDWCHSFSANRTGHPWDQALRRQRKWVMIERWKMQELITVLPSLIHLSLLLFAVGLCIYVWDINVTAAIPIICVSGAAFAFYTWSSIMASIIKLFPYTTIISRAFQSDLIHRPYAIMRDYYKRSTLLALTWIFFIVKWTLIALVLILFPVLAVICLPVLPLDIFRWICPSDHLPWNLSKIHDLDDILWLQPLMLWDDFTDLDGGGGRLYTSIRMYFKSAKHYIQSADSFSAPGDQDEMTSLALKWLIQNCETPSSVTIALQAIAGASSRIPSQPLKACQATLGILHRLVSGGPSISEGSETEMYFRALTFLESHAEEHQKMKGKLGIENNQDIQRSESTGDTEVAIWDLKSEHERQVVELINSTKFQPTKENIAALTMGNSATSLGLRLIKGERESISQKLTSIMDLLFKHVRGGKQKLDPAASHSLGHAAVVITSCSQDPLISRETIQQYMELCLSRLTTGTDSYYEPLRPRLEIPALEPKTAFVVCILLQSHTSSQATPASRRSSTRMGTRIKRATNLLTNKHFLTPSFQAVFYRAWLLEVCFNPAHNGSEWFEIDQYRRDVSSYYFPYAYLLPRTAQRSLTHPLDSNVDSTGVFDFLGALNEFYELMGKPTSQDPIAKRIPAPVYCTLIHITSRTQSEAQQALCEHILSYSAFPLLDEYLILAILSFAYMYSPEFRRWRGFQSGAPAEPQGFFKLPQWRNGNTDDPIKARSRHFAATQTWLLLCLVGSGLTDQQADLKKAIDQYLFTELSSMGVDGARRLLEEEIIRSYKKGHHLGVYSARVIECILEVRGELSNHELAQRVQSELKGAPPCIRGLSSFLDAPTIRYLKSHLPIVAETLTTEPGGIDSQPTENLPDAQPDSSLALPSVSTTNAEIPPSSGPSTSSIMRARSVRAPRRQNALDVTLEIEPEAASSSVQIIHTEVPPRTDSPSGPSGIRRRRSTHDVVIDIQPEVANTKDE